jgi:hypothetical protein
MNADLLIAEIVAFALAWWLGLYLLSRDLSHLSLRFAGLGLMTYALGLAADILAVNTLGAELSSTLVQWGWPLLFLPALFWFGTLVFLLPEEEVERRQLDVIVGKGLLPVAILFYLLAGGTELIVSIDEGVFAPGPWYLLFTIILAAFMLGALVILIRSLGRAPKKRPLGLIFIATLFFALGVALLLVPFDLFPRWILVLGIGIDLALLGLAIGILDAFSQGEAFLPDFTRSFTISLFAVLVFAGQVLLVMILATGVTFAMLVLLLATIAAAVAVQTFADPIQTGLDWLVFRRLPRVRRTRADLRLVASAVPRKPDTFDIDSLEEVQLTQITRRALSQMGNLPRLAASPLTRLAVIETRIREREVTDNTLERAAELKILLAESIDRLKPRGQGEFGTADAWRYYNALYYPYVAGLKPYSRRVNYMELNVDEEKALDWFQSQVPERTLYNWQNAAAKLVAQDIREQSQNGS